MFLFLSPMGYRKRNFSLRTLTRTTNAYMVGLEASCFASRCPLVVGSERLRFFYLTYKCICCGLGSETLCLLHLNYKCIYCVGGKPDVSLLATTSSGSGTFRLHAHNNGTRSSLQKSCVCLKEFFGILCLIAEPAGKARQRSSIAKEIW